MMYRIGLRTAAYLWAAAALGSGAFVHAETTSLVVARSVDADNLDPDHTTNTQSLQITNLMFDTLLTMASDGSVHPGLASEWSMSDDKLTYEFVIRDGIVCHDGTAFDANSAKFSIDRAVNPQTVNPNVSMWGPIESTSVDGNKVTVKLSKPYAALTAFLTSFQSGLMCPSSVKGERFSPVGTGPFKLANWTRNDRIELVANEAYRNFNPLIENPGAPFIKRLTIRVIPEAVARMAALESGEVQMAEPSLERAADMKNDPTYRVYAAEYSGQQAMAAFTWKIPPLDNEEIRTAIAHALNRDAYAQIAFEGLVEPAPCPTAPRLFATDLELCKKWEPAYDPNKAKEILAKYGYSPDKPLKVKLLYHTLPGWDQMHQMMQQDLRDVGIEADLEMREVAAFYEFMGTENKRTDGEPAVWTLGMSGVDPEYLYFLFRTPGFTNMGVNQELDAILDKQRELMGAQRQSQIQLAQKYLLEHVYTVPLVSPGWGWLMASTDKVSGFKMGFAVTLLFNDVKISE